MNEKYTIKDIVNYDLCTGCGICVSESSNSLKMEWDDFGFLKPVKIADFSNENAIRVCPFNPNPEKDVQDENKLANIFLAEAKKIGNKIGRFENIYVGYSNQFRVTSSSGGIATYVFERLLKDKVVDHLYIVKEINGTYKYQLFSDANNITKISKTRYLPVTLENLFNKIDAIEGTVAVSGVACFIKAIRLKQHYHPELKAKIPFLVGIICGGIKSTFFTDYLSQKAGIEANYSKQDYRIKDIHSQASDYSFGAFDSKNDFKQIKMRTVGEMWGTGMFKSNACDFCDDVTTELADISLGDAWLKPYNDDGHGTSVIVTRTAFADNLIQQGKSNFELSLETLSVENFLVSQQGSFNHRHKGLSVRINEAKKKKQPISIKRFDYEKSTFDFKIVQLIRMYIRKKSLNIWKNTRNAKDFDNKMKFSLFILKTATRIYHHKTRWMGKLNLK